MKLLQLDELDALLHAGWTPIAGLVLVGVLVLWLGYCLRVWMRELRQSECREVPTIPHRLPNFSEPAAKGFARRDTLNAVVAISDRRVS